MTNKTTSTLFTLLVLVFGAHAMGCEVKVCDPETGLCSNDSDALGEFSRGRNDDSSDDSSSDDDSFGEFGDEYGDEFGDEYGDEHGDEYGDEYGDDEGYGDWGHPDDEDFGV